jgi:dihydrofolate synthase/folylpolyglutamate synthase
MMANKDAEGFLKNFTGLARRIVTVAIPQQENAFSAAALADAARAIGLPAQECPDIEAALAAVASVELDQPPRILITGSLYLAGAALALNGTPPD